MKKNIRKFRNTPSLLCLLLALAMAMSLAACGASESENPETPEEPALSGEMAYTASFTPISMPEDLSLTPFAYTASGFYATSYGKIGEREPDEGEVVEYEGQLDLYGPSLYFVTSEGAINKLEGFTPLKGEEDTENRVSYNSGSELVGVTLDAEGKLLTLEQVYANWFDGDESEMEREDSWEKWRSERSYFVRRLDTDGSELQSNPVDYEFGEDTYFYTPSLYLDDRGNLLVTADTALFGITPEGQVAYQIEADEYINSVIRLKDGRLGVTIWGNNGMELRLLDSASGGFGEKHTLPGSAYDLMPGGGDYDLCYRNGSNLYGIKLETGESEKILNWINCDINGDYMNGLNIAPDGTITGVMMKSYWRGENMKRDTEFVTLSRVPVETLPKKETISLAVMYLPYELSDKIIEFNRKSDSVRIELQDYSEYNTEDDYTAGLTKFTTEILSGKMPDLLSLNGLPFSQLAAKGLLEDLYPYLDADKELSRDDFFPTVLEGMSYHGGLYRITPSFSVQGLIGASSVVGDTPGWNYDEFKAALASMPEGCTPLDQYTTRDQVLSSLLMLDMDDFVDWSTGKCSFDSQEFVDLLTFANSFQADFDWDAYEWSEEESAPNRIAQGRQMLMQAGVYSFDDILYNDMYFGGSSTYIGWPTNNGVGNMLALSDGAFAMSAGCKNKEAGWEFIRSILSEDYQRSQYGLPVIRKIFDEKLKEAMTAEYEKDESGNYLLDENGERIQISRGGVGFGDGTVYELYALSQEQADKLLEVINTTTKVAESNDSIASIVTEQAQAYFAGQKSPEEVARLVQSKANIYVNEQR